MNITQLIYQNAEKDPFKKAIITPVSYDAGGRICYSHYTFQQFVEQSQTLSKNLHALGIQEGQKVLLFVKPSLEFSLLVFTLFSIGAIPILIDPGVGRKNLLAAIKKVKPDVLVGEPLVHVIRRFFPSSFASVHLNITTKRASPFTSSISLMHLIKKREDEKHFVLKDVDENSSAAIVYTSGATGVPKGVLYTHRMFYQQVKLLQKLLPIEGQDVDLSCFPLFSLTAMAMGMSSVIPWLDAAKPASVNPYLLVQHILDQGVTLATGSPAIWQRLADHCVQNKIVLSSVKGVVMFGAPVSLKLHEQMKPLLPNGTTYTPYGATECLPVSWISGETILNQHYENTISGKGTCIGTAVPETNIRIIAHTPDVIPKWEQVKELPNFEVGEIVVSGPQATEVYFEHPEETLKSKIYGSPDRFQRGMTVNESSFWHRMGDLGYKDDSGNLWFCGRKAHRVVTSQKVYNPIPCEAIFNQHPHVKRSALIAVHDRDQIKPAIVLERIDAKDELSEKEQAFFRAGLLALGRKYDHTRSIDTFFLHKTFPVDCRHNIKIDRSYLSEYFDKRQNLTF
jgi:acyl-CoA synthetase (AMP-forming)/AMP-acid ligase II